MREKAFSTLQEYQDRVAYLRMLLEDDSDLSAEDRSECQLLFAELVQDLAGDLNERRVPLYRPSRVEHEILMPSLALILDSLSPPAKPHKSTASMLSALKNAEFELGGMLNTMLESRDDDVVVHREDEWVSD